MPRPISKHLIPAEDWIDKYPLNCSREPEHYIEIIRHIQANALRWAAYSFSAEPSTRRSLLVQANNLDMGKVP